MIEHISPDAKLQGPLASVLDAQRWFAENAPPDLVLLDIMLEDGDAFALLDRVDVAAPVVFCTAYAEHALRAFEANSIDYLLKPVSEPRLRGALAKYALLTSLDAPPDAWRRLRSEGGQSAYRSRFLVTTRRGIRIVPIENVTAIAAKLKAVNIITSNGEELPFEETLTGVVDSLDPADFHQISRQHAVRLSTVEAIEKSGGRWTVRLAGSRQTFAVSRARRRGLEDLLKGEPCGRCK